MQDSTDTCVLANQVLDYLCPYLVQAGDYALRVQKGIGKRPAKEGSTDPFGAALTDADLSIQTFIEVVLLSRFPELGFFGEEHAQSFNMKYFPQGASLTLYLDPVDGTLFFQDGLDNFNVIATLADSRQILGAACYVPGRDKLFRAVRGARTSVQTAGQARKGQPGTILDISSNPPVILTYNQHEIASRLSKDFEIFSIENLYRAGEPCLGPNSLLLQQASVLLGGNSGLIDWGAIAFLVEQAGGITSDWQGNEVPPIGELPHLCFPSLLACCHPAVHRHVTGILSSV